MKRNCKRIFCLFVGLLMALSLIAPAALAEEVCQHDYEGSRHILRDSSCLQSGIVMDVCNLCGEKVFLAIPAAHTFGQEADKITDPSCNEEGMKVWYCQICNAEKQDDHDGVKTEAIPAVHSYSEEVDYLLPTCEEAGRFVHACQVCGECEVLDVNEEAPALGHQTETQEVAATCQAAAKKIIRCTVCEKVIEEEELADQPAVPHEMNEEALIILEATCEAEGQQANVCIHYAECGYVFEETMAAIAALGHQEIVVPVQEATCKDDGAGNLVCAQCDVVFEENVIIPADTVNCVLGEKVLRAPSCNQYGICEISCIVCGKVEGYQLIAFAHKDGEAHINVQPSCLEAGEAEYFCTDCGIFLRKEEIPAVGHVFSEIPVLTTDCLEGVAATIYCTVCGAAEQIAFDPTLVCEGHQQVYRYEMPTCTQPGLLVIECQECDKEAVKIPFDADAAHGHKLGEEPVTLKEATCTEKGEAALVCQICKENVELLPIEALGHDVSQEVTQQPTCITEGVAKKFCKICGEVFNENMPVEKLEACADLKVDVQIANSCSKPGFEKHTCNICGKVSYHIIPAGHMPGEVEVLMDSTCAAEGKGLIKCTLCGIDLEETVIACKEHAYTQEPDYVEEASCLHGGAAYYCCIVCNAEKNLELADVRKIDLGPATEHVMAEETTYLPADCVRAGREVRKCTVCDYHELVSIDRNAPALNHKVLYALEEATCEIPTMSIGTCETCGKVVDAVVVELEGENEALGHTPAEEWKLIEDATCTTAGLEELLCTVCGDVLEIREIPICECNQIHTLTLVEEDCSIGRNQIVMTECEFCHKDMGLKIVEFKHEFREEDAVITIEPTCQNDGEKVYTCTECKYQEAVVLPMLDHAEVDSEHYEIIGADCINPDMIIVRCRYCGAILDEQIVENSLPFGHVYGVYDPDADQIVCLYCHEVQPEELADEVPAVEEVPMIEVAVETEIPAEEVEEEKAAE